MDFCACYTKEGVKCLTMEFKLSVLLIYQRRSSVMKNFRAQFFPKKWKEKKVQRRNIRQYVHVMKYQGIMHVFLFKCSTTASEASQENFAFLATNYEKKIAKLEHLCVQKWGGAKTHLCPSPVFDSLPLPPPPSPTPLLYVYFICKWCIEYCCVLHFWLLSSLWDYHCLAISILLEQHTGTFNQMWMFQVYLCIYISYFIF